MRQAHAAPLRRAHAAPPGVPPIPRLWWLPLKGSGLFRLRRGRLFYGWVIVGVASLVGFSQASVLNPVLSVFIKPMSEEFGWSRGAISAGVSLGALATVMITPFLGRFIDRWGTRYILAVTTLIISVVLFAMGRVQYLWQFQLLFGLGRLMSAGVGNLAIGVATSNWFVRQRGRALGMTVMGTRAGMAALPLLAQEVINVASWRAAWGVLGVLVLALTQGPILLFMRRRPEDLGLLPDGQGPAAQTAEVKVLSQRSSQAPGTTGAQQPDVHWTLAEAWRTRAFWLLILMVVQAFFVLPTMNLHHIPYLTDRGIPAAAAVGAMSLSAILAVPSSLLFGLLAERIPVRMVLAAVLFATALALVYLLHVDSVFGAYVYGVLWGVLLGAVLTLNQVIWADYFGRLELGTIRGVVSPFEAASIVIGPVFAGGLFDLTGSYQLPFAIFVVSLVAASLWSLLAAPPQHPLRQIGREEDATA